MNEKSKLTELLPARYPQSTKSSESIALTASNGLAPWTAGTEFVLHRRCFIASLMLASTVGCQNFLHRSQSPDNTTIPVSQLAIDDKKTTSGLIGQIATIYGINYARVEGIGLAFGLRETGSNPKPGGQREYLVRELQSMDLDTSIETLLAGKDTELVLLKGMIPPGARRGDRFDIEIGTMRSSEVTSLDHGMVSKTNLRPMEQMGRTIQKGHNVALGSGRILIDSLFESRKDQSNDRNGFILGGGTLAEDREYGVKLTNSGTSMRNAMGITRAINARFTYVDKAGRHGVADPKTDDYIVLVTPHEYRHNFGRFLQVVFNMAFNESASQRLERLERLEQEMLVASESEISSLRLEAIGPDSVPILKRVYRHEDLEIKFHAAQALAYLGEPDGVEHLRFVAEKEPALRWHALNALATINYPEATQALKSLLQVNSAETRYGAFQALQAQAPNDPILQGKLLGDFHFHQIASTADQPMMHFSRKGKAEIVLFGDDQRVTADFLHVEPNLTIRANSNETVTITRHTVEGDQKRVVSNRVADLIEAFFQSGLYYGDQIKIFQAAKNAGTLQARLAVNTLPKLGRTYIPGQFSSEPNANESIKYTNDPLPGTKGEPAIKRKQDSDADPKMARRDASTGGSDENQTSINRLRNWFTGQTK